MKTVLMLGAGLEQRMAIQQAQKLGIAVIAFDGNPQACGFADVDISACVDISDVDAVIAAASQYAFDGVFCHGVELPHVVSRVAHHFGLPGLAPEVADLATDKARRMARFKACGIPSAEYRLVEDLASLQQAAEALGYPVVVKPIDSAGARGVQWVETAGELALAYQEAARYSRAQAVMVESVLEGPEISTEAVVYQGEIHTFAFADRNYARKREFKPFVIEDGINFPSVLPAATQRQVIEVAEAAIRCLGIDFGAAKGDIIIHQGTPTVIEMASRTSGGWFGAGSIEIATGSNMLIPLLQMAVGLRPDLAALAPTRQLGCAQRYIIPTESGIVSEVAGVDEVASSPGVQMCELFLPQLGATVRRAQNHADRLGQVICVGDTREQAIARCEQALGKLTLRISPSSDLATCNGGR